MEEINAATLKIDTLEAKLQLALKEKEETIRANVAGTILENQETPTGIDSQAYEKAFLNFIKGKSTVDDQMVIQAALSSGTDEDGGLLIPKDQETKVIELARAYSSLRDLVYVRTCINFKWNLE